MDVSCIIPCYNEQGRIGKVLDVALSTKIIDEVLVVDNASTDKTIEEIRERETGKLRIIRHKKNLGKAKSIADGISIARGEYIILLDADLQYLTTQNLESLVSPLINGSYDMVLSQRGNLENKLTGTTFITGERSVRKKVIENVLQEYKIEGYSIENAINKYAIKNRLRIGKVAWGNVKHIQKKDKRGFVSGIWEEIQMYLDIYKNIGFLEFYKQWLVMKFIVSKIS